MIRRCLVFLGLFAGTPCSLVTAQTVPPDTWDRAVPAARPNTATKPSPAPRPNTAPKPDTRRLLTGPESQQRIAEAKKLLREGALADADGKLRGQDFAVRLDGGLDARDVAFVHGLAAYSDGRLRPAWDQTLVIHRAKRSGDVNVDAALLKSLICLRAGVFAVARQWADWANSNSKDNIAAAGILKLLAETKVENFTLDRTVPHERVRDCKIDVWRGTDTSAQPLTLVVRKDDDVRGAFVLESIVTAQGKARVFELRFYDFEGRPLPVTYYGTSKPAEAELLARAQEFNPQPGKDRYSIMRAELEALSWQREGVAPYAVRWAEYALAGSQLVAEQVQKPLRAARNWTWEFRGQDEAGPGPESRLDIRSYANREVADAAQWKDVRGPLEHFHFAVNSKTGAKYLGSFLIATVEPLPGERIYFLYFLFDGARQEVKRYDDLDPPTYEQIKKDVWQALEAGPAKVS